MNFKNYSARLWASFTYVGLIFATLFFAASLTPSLLPRIYIVQGIQSGFLLAVGYGVGVFVVWLWHYLQLPEPNEKSQRICKQVITVCVAIVAVGFSWRATVWQNSIRDLMGMQPLESADPWRIAAIAICLGVALIGAARILWKSCELLSNKLNHILPPRIATILGTLIVAALFFLLANDVFAKLALHFADGVFLKLDEQADHGIEQPTDARASGSTDSLVPWDTIGHKGKLFITDGPTKEQISKFSGKSASRPLRVYVGLRSKESLKERATLALEELKRVGGFDRSRLIVSTPTGTGWLDPSAVDTLEYLHGGDTAIVSMQYSYLPSWITILVDPNRSKDSAHALFDEVYGYWKTLDKDSRPKLYLQGLSLGSLGSETCADLFTLFEDPIQGAVWSGPPFPSTRWQALTKGRNPDSPAWLPTFRDGSMVRFTAQKNSLNQPGEHWGPMRFVYIQHASDPMVFFSPDLMFHEPDWMIGKRGPDVSPYLRWTPIVTFLQMAFDLPMATSVPMGYGHNYAPSGYINAWVSVTEPEAWSEEDTKRLKQLFITSE